jgi:5-methylcytosine-specific restriction endonuclease McrA
MQRDIFERDYEECCNRLKHHKRIGFFKKLFSLGMLNNDKLIQEWEVNCKNSLADLRKRDDFLQIAKKIDSENDAMEVKGIRICSYTFADIRGDGYEGYPDNWEQIRKEILERDNYECQEADGYCRGPLQIHHIKELSKGGANHSDNLITLCRHHHSLKHEHMK